MSVIYAKVANINNISRSAAKSRRQLLSLLTAPPRRAYSTEGKDESQNDDGQKEQGAMSRRLSEMTEQTVLEGGRSAQRDMQQVGFSEELKRQLEERIAGSSFRNEFAAAHSLVDMPVRYDSFLKNGFKYLSYER